MMTTWQAVRRISRYLKPYRLRFLAASVSMFFFVVFNMATIVLIVPFINVLFASTPPQYAPPPAFSFGTAKDWAITTLNNLLAANDEATTLKILCVLIIVSFTLKNLFQYLQTWFNAPAEQGMIRDLRDDLYVHLNRLSLSYFSNEKKGVLMSRIVNDVRLVNDSAIAVLNSIFRDPPQLITYTVILFVVDWQLTLVVFLLLPATGFVLAKIGNVLKRESGTLQEAMADITAVLDEGISSMRIVKAFRMEQWEVGKFRTHNRQYYDTYVRITRRRELSSPITEVLSVTVVVFILWFMGEKVLAGTSAMSSGVFVMYILAMLQMMQPLKLFGQMVSGVAQGLTGARRVFDVLDMAPGISDRPGAATVDAFRDRIEFRDVRFRYDDGDEILSGIDLEVLRGQIIAIVGPSGVGKSTLVDLVPRFHDVTGGAIALDGRDIRDITVDSLRSLMGIVTQETFLFNATIRENIAYGRPDIPLDEVIAAARAANAHEFIVDTPQGYDTVIGDRGVKLSGGQRQRLSIARAILKNPPILILDEATSSLDTESELLVQNAIENLMAGRTTIVIAHRLSTIQRADRIYVLSGGRVVEAGRHEELLANEGGVYQHLYSLQFKVGAP